MFFDTWENLLRVFMMGVGCYLGMILLLRISGNRTLSKMNSFDFVVTIALGSTFGSAILQKSITLADGFVAFATLIGLQFVTTWLSVRIPFFHRLITSEPIVVFSKGQFLRHAMKQAHITEEEVLTAMRSSGFAKVSEVLYVILEENGKVVAVGK